MEAPPPLSPPRPPCRPHPCLHQTPPSHLRQRARKDPKPGIFSPSGNNPEAEVVGNILPVSVNVNTAKVWILLLDSWTVCCPSDSSPQPLLLALPSQWGFFCHLILSCGTSWIAALPEMPFAVFSITWICDEDGLLTGWRSRICFPSRSRTDNHQPLCWSGATSGSHLLLAWHSSMGFVGRGHIRVWGNRPEFSLSLTTGQMKLEIHSQNLKENFKKCSRVRTKEYLCEYQIICAYLKSEQDSFNRKFKPLLSTKERLTQK